MEYAAAHAREGNVPEVDRLLNTKAMLSPPVLLWDALNDVKFLEFIKRTIKTTYDNIIKLIIKKRYVR